MPTNFPPIHQIWVYLSGNPLFALVITLAAYAIGVKIYESTQRNPLANPLPIAVVLISSVLLALDMPYVKYFEGAQFVHFLLGTATVSLAVPIYKGRSALQGRVGVLLLALIAGGVTSILVSVSVLRLLGADQALIQGMYAKSVTTPIAMGIADRIHASPTLTAVFALSSGVIGAVLGRWIFNLLRITAWWQRGFALGVAAHGVGTSRALSIHPAAGALASLGMGLSGILGSVLIPVVFRYF